MSVSRQLDVDLESLPMDVFDLADSGLTVESLTAGHGMAEIGGQAYAPTFCCDCITCACTTCAACSCTALSGSAPTGP